MRPRQRTIHTTRTTGPAGPKPPGRWADSCKEGIGPRSAEVRMNHADPLHDTLRAVHRMNRSQCIDELTHFPDIPLDFSEDFLQNMSVERLRHLLAAAVLTVHQRKAG